MPLENLLTLIEKLREHIERHGDALRQSEALTRYALIDPTTAGDHEGSPLQFITLTYGF